MSEYVPRADTDPIEDGREPPPIPVGPPYVSSAVAVRGSTALDVPGERLPVLEAFQEFLAVERRRARNRMLILSGVFAAVIAALVVGGIAFALSLMDPMRREVESLQAQIGTFARRADRVGNKADQTLDRLTKQEREFTDRLARGRQEVADVRTSIGHQTSSISGELSHVQSMLAELRRENQLLLKEMLDIRQVYPAASDHFGPVRWPSGAAQPPEPTPGLAAAGEASITLNLATSDDEAPIAWRIPMPE